MSIKGLGVIRQQWYVIVTAVSLSAEECQLIIFQWYFLFRSAEELIQIPSFKHTQLHKELLINKF